MLLGLFLAILTGLSWVLVGAVVGLAEKRECGSERLMLVGSIFSVTLVGLSYAVGPLVLSDPEPFRVTGNLLGAVAMFFCGFFNFCMILAMGRAMAIGPNGPVWTITQSGFVIPALVGVVCGNTPFSWLLAVGILLSLANVIANGLARGDGSGGAQRQSRKANWFPLAFLAFLFCGTNQCANLVVSFIQEDRRPMMLERFLWLYVGVFTGWLLHAAWKRLREGAPARDPDIRAKYVFLLKICSVNSLVAFIASVFFSYPAQDILADHDAGAIAFPVMVVSCFLGFAVYSRLALRERLTTMQKIAFATGIAGIVILFKATS